MCRIPSIKEECYFACLQRALSNSNLNVHYLKMILDNASIEGLLASKFVFFKNF